MQMARGGFEGAMLIQRMKAQFYSKKRIKNGFKGAERNNQKKKKKLTLQIGLMETKKKILDAQELGSVGKLQGNRER